MPLDLRIAGVFIGVGFMFVLIGAGAYLVLAWPCVVGGRGCEIAMASTPSAERPPRIDGSAVSTGFFRLAQAPSVLVVAGENLGARPDVTKTPSAGPSPPATSPSPATALGASPQPPESPSPNAVPAQPSQSPLPSNSPAPSPVPSPTSAPTISPRTPAGTALPETRMVLVKVIRGHLAAKSIVASGTGLFFAQNMMYMHTINVYNRNFELLKIIRDTVDLAALGHPQYRGTYGGAPVEAAFSPDGKVAYVSNYSMYGAKPFDREGTDDCTPANHFPQSFVYRIKLATLTIDQAIAVGAVPKFVAITPDNKYLLVSNWCSYTESVVDVAAGRQIAQIPLGAFPRGIAVNAASTKAYVAVMGSTSIAIIDLHGFGVSWIRNVGRAPRHLVLSPDGNWLYATINGEAVVDKIDLATGEVVARARTGKAPRSMAISNDGSFLYIVNYESNTLSKVRASDMRVLQSVPTNPRPIGVTYDSATHRVWVSCYSGSIMVFDG